MFLKRITLKNYRRYRDADIEIPTGIMGIVGKNGTGKSSLIEAIGWCLYGISRTGNDQIKTTGIDEHEDCIVVLEMMLGDDAVKITRKLQGKTQTGHASIFVNGSATPQVRGVKEVSEFITKRTGMDHVAFFTSVFAKQKELNSLSTKRPMERKKTIMKLLKINKIDDAIKLIRSDIRTSRDQISLLQNDSNDIESLQITLNKITKEKSANTKLIQKHNAQIVSLEKEKRAKEIEFIANKKKYDDFNKLNQLLIKTETQKNSKLDQKEEIESDLHETRLSEKEMKNIEPKVKEYDKINIEKKKLDLLYGKAERKKEIDDQLSSTIIKIKKLHSTIEKIKKDLSLFTDLNKKYIKQTKELAKEEDIKESLTDSFSKISSKITENQTQIIQFKKEFLIINNLGKNGKCPICKRKLDKYFPIVSKYFNDEISKYNKKISVHSKRKNELNLQLKSVKKLIAEISENIKILENKKRNRSSTQTKLKENEKQFSTINLEKNSFVKKLKLLSSLNYDSKYHSEINKQYDSLSKIKEKYIELLSDVKRIPSLIKKQEQLDTMILKLDKTQKEQINKLNSIDYDESKYAKSEKNLESANQTYNKTRENKIQLSGEIQTFIVQIKQIQKEIKKEKEKKSTIDDENEKIESRSKLEQIMNEFKNNLILRIRPMLSQRSSELFRNITKGKYPLIELDENYDINIEDNGNQFGIKRFSGGEEDLANLCLRIAISKELSERTGGMQSNFIALDEIFGSQDEERKKDILNTLSVLSNQFKQILIITHIEDVKETLPYVLSLKETSENSVKIETEGIASFVTP